MSDNSSPTTKKRKANDGRATVSHDGGGRGLFSSLLGYFSWRRDEITPTTCGGENLTHKKLDTMMQMMSRMEKKLTTVSSLESRCERLEAECSSLKNTLSDVKKIQHGQFEYNNMLVRNQSWKYKAQVYSEEHWENNGYDEDVAEYLTNGSDCLKDSTEIMRRGEFPCCGNNTKGIDLEWNEGDPILSRDAISNMRPHWEEFAQALKQLTPAFGVLPDDCKTYFTFENIQLDRFIPGLLQDALMNKPFQTLRFMNKTGARDNEGMSVTSIMDIVDSNKHLRKLTIENTRIRLDHIARICSAVRYGSIVDLNLLYCFENGLGDEMVTSLLTSGGLGKLERLDLDSNGITSNGITLLADFLATNPMLKELDLRNNDNSLSGDCVDLLANALRNNKSLRSLQLYGNTISDDGDEALRLVVHDDSSLNSIADSNHSCVLDGVGFHSWNVYQFWKDGTWHEAPESFNRARKIYKLLSERNKSTSMSNVQYFDDIDVKLLPSIIEAVQRYAGVVNPDEDDHCRVKALSIVYEVMRKWDKVFPLYTD